MYDQACGSVNVYILAVTSESFSFWNHAATLPPIFMSHPPSSQAPMTPRIFPGFANEWASALFLPRYSVFQLGSVFLIRTYTVKEKHPVKWLFLIAVLLKSMIWCPLSLKLPCNSSLGKIIARLGRLSSCTCIHIQADEMKYSQSCQHC